MASSTRFHARLRLPPERLIVVDDRDNAVLIAGG